MATVADDTLVGKRIRVWWAGDNAWYVGVVKKYNEVKRQHHVHYEDGDKKWHELCGYLEVWELAPLESRDAGGNAKGWIACGTLGCILADRHSGLHVFPEPTGRRSSAAPSVVQQVCIPIAEAVPSDARLPEPYVAAPAPANSTAVKYSGQPVKMSFTPDEDDAIHCGVERHGIGKWALIISEDARLARRNSDSVRCRYNTLARKGGVGCATDAETIKPSSTEAEPKPKPAVERKPKPAAEPKLEPEPEAKPESEAKPEPEAKPIGKALEGRRILVYWGGDDGAPNGFEPTGAPTELGAGSLRSCTRRLFCESLSHTVHLLTARVD